MPVYRIHIDIPNVVGMDTRVMASPSMVLDVVKYLKEKVPDWKLTYFQKPASERDTWNPISLSDLELAVEGKRREVHLRSPHIRR